MNITGRTRKPLKRKKVRKQKMSKLYELTGDYLTLLDMLESGEEDEQVMLDTLEAVQGEIEVKAESYAKIIKMLEGDAETIKAEEERLSARRKTLKNNADRLKRHLEQCMVATGLKKLKTDLFSFNIQANPQSVVIDSPGELPAEFLIPQEPKVDKVRLKELLKKQDVPYAHLESSEGLRIR